MNNIKEIIVGGEKYTDEEIKVWKEDKVTKKIFNFLQGVENYYLGAIASISTDLRDSKDMGVIANMAGRIFSLKLVMDLDIATIDNFGQDHQLEPTELL
jgi:hypothetical protein